MTKLIDLVEKVKSHLDHLTPIVNTYHVSGIAELLEGLRQGGELVVEALESSEGNGKL